MKMKPEWTEHLRHEIKHSALPDILLEDGVFFNKSYPALDRAERVWFYVRLFTLMMKPESNYNPTTLYQEPGGKRGPGTLSIGLLQMSVEDDANYDLDMHLTKQKLMDPLVNISVAVRVAEAWLGKHKRLTGYAGGKWLGLARYWSCMRPTKVGRTRESFVVILKSMRETKLK